VRVTSVEVSDAERILDALYRLDLPLGALEEVIESCPDSELRKRLRIAWAGVVSAVYFDCMGLILREYPHLERDQDDDPKSA
jgi:hypothetical protein